MEKNKYRGGLEKYITLLISALIIFLAGVWFGQVAVLPFGSNQKIINLTNKDTPSYVNVDFAPFWSVWEQVTRNHLNSENVDPQKLLYGAISGMVNAVGDPYSVFLDPKQNSEFLSSLSGTFEGVGIELGSRNNKLVVVAPLVNHVKTALLALHLGHVSSGMSYLANALFSPRRPMQSSLISVISCEVTSTSLRTSISAISL